MLKQKMLVVGLTRNCERHLFKTYSRLKAAFVDFDLHWLIVESDSSDSTLAILKQLKLNDSKFNYVSFGALTPTMPARTQRIAHCRNFYTEQVRSNSEYSSFDYVVAADFDGINNLLTRAGVLSCWDYDGWDVVSANQSGRYYDIWCLRHISWSPDDCWKKYAKLRSRGLSHFKASRKAVYSRMIRIKNDSPWLEVDSAHAGLTIYTKESFIAGKHIWQDTDGEETCEIVQYNEELRSKGYRIFINPKLINGGINEHSRQSYLYHQFYVFLKSKIKSRRF